VIQWFGLSLSGRKQFGASLETKRVGDLVKLDFLGDSTSWGLLTADNARGLAVQLNKLSTEIKHQPLEGC